MSAKPVGKAIIELEFEVVETEYASPSTHVSKATVLLDSITDEGKVFLWGPGEIDQDSVIEYALQEMRSREHDPKEEGVTNE